MCARTTERCGAPENIWLPTLVVNSCLAVAGAGRLVGFPHNYESENIRAPFSTRQTESEFRLLSRSRLVLIAKCTRLGGKKKVLSLERVTFN